MRRHRDFCRGQYSPIGQESKEELAGVYRLDTAGKAARIRRRQKSEGRSRNAEVRIKKQERRTYDFYSFPLHSYFCILTSYSLFENAGKEALHLSEKAARLLLRWRWREHGGGHRGGCARRREGHGITIQARRWRRLQVTGPEDEWRVHLHLNLAGFGSRDRQTPRGRDRQGHLGRRLCTGYRNRALGWRRHRLIFISGLGEGNGGLQIVIRDNLGWRSSGAHDRNGRGRAAATRRSNVDQPQPSGAKNNLFGGLDLVSAIAHQFGNDG